MERGGPRIQEFGIDLAAKVLDRCSNGSWKYFSFFGTITVLKVLKSSIFGIIWRDWAKILTFWYKNEVWKVWLIQGGVHNKFDFGRSHGLEISNMRITFKKLDWNIDLVLEKMRTTSLRKSLNIGIKDHFLCGGIY